MFQILIKRKDYVKAGVFTTEAENVLNKYSNKILIETELSIRFYIVKALILSRSYDKALTSINNLLTHPLINKR
jgi:hypothetical protein